MDWRDEGTPEWRESLTPEQEREWRDWQFAAQQASAQSDSEPGTTPPPSDGDASASGDLGPEPDATGKPWDGMDPFVYPGNDWILSLTDAEAEEFAEWRSWHEQRKEQEEDARHEEEQRERDEKLRREIEHEQETGEIDPYRLARGAPPPPGATVGFVDQQGNSVDAVVKDQPLRLQVTVPLKAGETPGKEVEVAVSGQRLTFIGREYEATDQVTLAWIGNTTGDPIYRSDLLTIEKGGEGVEDLGVPGFEFNTGGMGGFSVDDGGIVQVTHGGTTTGVQVFSSFTKLELALTLAAISAFHQIYTNVVINSNNLEKQLQAKPDSPEKADLLDKLRYTRGQAQQVLTLANKAIAFVNQTDTLDHQKLAVIQQYGRWMGLFAPVQYGPDGKPKPHFGPIQVPSPSDEIDAIHFASAGAKEEVRRIMWAGLTQATIGGYRLLAQATMVAQIMTIFGTNEMGQQATGMERWMAFADLLSQGALMGAMMKWNLSTMTPSRSPAGVPRTTARIPRVEPVADPKTAAASPTGTPVAPEAAGMLRQAGRDAQLIMRKHDKVAQVRFTNPEAMVPRATGAAPKPMQMKSKTLQEIDHIIGAPDGAQNGCVGLFEPRMPQRTADMSDAYWQKIQERFDLRKAEWEGAIGQYQRKLVDKGDFQMRDGMMCDKDGKPIAGDYDLFEITNRDGSPVTQAEYDAIVADLMAAPGFQAAHGAHMRWNPKITDEGYHFDISGDTQLALDAVAKWQADRQIFRGIIARHQPGQEGLITFAPSQPPVITYAGEGVGPKLADIGVTPSAAGAGPDGGFFIRPTLMVATTDQLLARRYPTEPGWEWTDNWDWQAEVDDWQQQFEALQQPIVISISPTQPEAFMPFTPAAEGQGFNWRPLLFAGVVIGTLVVAVGGGVLFFSNQNAALPPVSVVSPTPVAPQATLGGVVPDRTPAGLQPNPTPAISTAAPTQGGVVPAPTATSGTAPSVPATLVPASPPSLAWDPEPGNALVDLVTNGTLTLTEEGLVSALDSDPPYLPHDGSPATANQPWIDLRGAALYPVSVGQGAAVAISSHPCGDATELDGLVVYTACNRPGPMPAGDYLAFVTHWAAPIPDPFPQPAQCAYILQSDVDGDRSTGFQSQLPFNHLIGSDIYYENLFFWNQAGEFQNYILGTDHSMPARPDTAEVHGNLPTSARWFSTSYRSTDGGQTWVQVGLIPQEEFGDNWSVGGFCNADRSVSSPETFSVDALGNPRDEIFPDYYPREMPPVT